MDFGIGFLIARHDSRIEIGVRNSYRFRSQRFTGLVHFSGMGRLSMIGIGYTGTIADELVVTVEVV